MLMFRERGISIQLRISGDGDICYTKNIVSHLLSLHRYSKHNSNKFDPLSDSLPQLVEVPFPNRVSKSHPNTCKYKYQYRRKSASYCHCEECRISKENISFDQEPTYLSAFQTCKQKRIAVPSSTLLTRCQERRFRLLLLHYPTSIQSTDQRIVPHPS